MTSQYGICLDSRNRYKLVDFGGRKPKAIARGLSYQQAKMEFERVAGFPYSLQESRWSGDYTPEPRGG